MLPRLTELYATSRLHHYDYASWNRIPIMGAAELIINNFFFYLVFAVLLYQFSAGPGFRINRMLLLIANLPGFLLAMSYSQIDIALSLILFTGLPLTMLLTVAFWVPTEPASEADSSGIALTGIEEKV